MIYNHDIVPGNCPVRDGYVRASMKFAGIVGEPGAGATATKITQLLNLDFKGLVPFAITRDGLLAAMFYISVKKHEIEDRDACPHLSNPGVAVGGEKDDAESNKALRQRIATLLREGEEQKKYRKWMEDEGLRKMQALQKKVTKAEERAAEAESEVAALRKRIRMKDA